jgi:hypothetical protein
MITKLNIVIQNIKTIVFLAIFNVITDCVWLF